MNYISTRNNHKNFTSEQVLNYGLAPDGGLFIPSEIPKFSIGDIKNLKNADYQEIAYFVLLRTLEKDRSGRCCSAPLTLLEEISI